MCRVYVFGDIYLHMYVMYMLIVYVVVYVRMCV